MAGPSRIHGVIPWAVAVLWAGSALGGFLALERYAQTPGEARELPSEWPAACEAPRDPNKATLLCFLHPHCPCSRATVAELARLLRLCEGRMGVYVYFWTPARADEAWAHGSLWNATAAVEGVTLQADVGGVEARRLGATTSGQVLLFAPDGRLLFGGGITDRRGHAGDSVGSAAVVVGARSGHAAGAPFPVYGCPLHD